jgi:5-methylcytosine-specific restriction endonuclease McrA
MNTISRKEAKAQGRKRFFTGEPCPKGHVSERMVSNSNCVECLRLASAAYHERHRERLIADMREYAKRDAEGNRRRSREWAANNRGKAAEWKVRNRDRATFHQRNREARKRMNGSDFTLDQWVEIQERFGRCCVCCGEAGVALTVDHIVPVSRGGVDSYENIQPLCRTCNGRKGTQTIDYREVFLASKNMA